ncbi:MAG: HNH endonuclease [Nanoarchaeota archaeon]|nr:HNH endonuclease [Nanoarchaeota archaeon]
MVSWFKDKNGYPRFKDSGKLVHRWKAEKKIGRPLKSWEVVHHRNEKKTDYSDKNLAVMSRSFHAKLHANKRNRKWSW